MRYATEEAVEGFGQLAVQTAKEERGSEGKESEVRHEGEDGEGDEKGDDSLLGIRLVRLRGLSRRAHGCWRRRESTVEVKRDGKGVVRGR